MPIHDYRCPFCDLVCRDVYRPLVTLDEPRVEHGYKVTQDFDRPICTRCTGHGLHVIMHIIPPRVTVDALEPCQEFDTTVEDGRGGHRIEHIDSLTKLRQVERESEQRHRNGEGRPLVWRDYSQDASNKDVHTLGTIPEGPSAEARRRFGRSTMKVSKDEPEGAYGPGVNDSNTSALGE